MILGCEVRKEYKVMPACKEFEVILAYREMMALRVILGFRVSKVSGGLKVLLEVKVKKDFKDLLV